MESRVLGFIDAMRLAEILSKYLPEDMTSLEGMEYSAMIISTLPEMAESDLLSMMEFIGAGEVEDISEWAFTNKIESLIYTYRGMNYASK